MLPLSNLTTRVPLSSGVIAPTPRLFLLPLEIREEVENHLPIRERQSFFKALTTVTHNGDLVDSPALKLHLLQKRIAPKYQWALFNADESLRAFALNQLHRLWEAGQLDQLAEKPALFELLNLVANPTIYGFLREEIQPEPELKEKLLNWVECSKTEEVQTVAANALTILVKSGVQFNGANLKGIRVPGADLSGVKLHASWLRQANLTGAQMVGVRFGEKTYLQVTGGVLCCAYSPDGKACVVGSNDGELGVYATANWEKIYTLSGHFRCVWSVAYSPNGAQIVSGGFDGRVRVWDTHSGEILRILPGYDPVRSVAYSPDGGQIVAGSDDGAVRVWDADTGEARFASYVHIRNVTSVAYSPAGDQLASSGFDQRVDHMGRTHGKAPPCVQRPSQLY